MNDDKSLDHELRIRLMEDFIVSLEKKIQQLQDKMDNQFNLVIGAVLTSCIAVILHMYRLL